MEPRIAAAFRRLGVEEAPLLAELRREALESEPFAFAASIEDDIALPIESIRSFLAKRDTQAVHGAFLGPDLAGMIGLYRPSGLKQQHKAMIWGMYVQPRHRRSGLGRALLGAAIGQAGEWPVVQVHLCVTEAARAARRLYESAGFRVWGTEPRALQWNGRFVAEHHLVLDLGRAG